MQWNSTIVNMSSIIPGIGDTPTYVSTSLEEVAKSPNSTYAIYGAFNADSSPLDDLYYAIYTWILGDYKVAVDLSHKHTPTELLDEVFSTYDLVYEYFFLASGLTLVMLAMLLFLGKKRKTVGEYSSIALRFFIGFGLCLVVLMDTLQNSPWDNYAIQNNYFNFQQSAWVLPAVMFGYLLGE